MSAIVPVPDLVEKLDQYLLDQATSFIQNCDDAQVVLTLNKLTAARFKHLMRQQALSFTPGTKVRFTIRGKKRKLLNGDWEGYVTRLRGRRVEVRATRVDKAWTTNLKVPKRVKQGSPPPSTMWTVSADMLVPVR